MHILSLFDGISCGRLALERAGIPVTTYYASEIDPYAIKITERNYPDTIQVGDIRHISYVGNTLVNHANDVCYYTGIDLVIGGSPCQDLSSANGNGKGLLGEKSGLFYEYLRLIKEIRPKYFLLENVASMSRENREKITELLREVYPDVMCYAINSALVSAQNRKRLYWTNIFCSSMPGDRGICLADILEDIPLTDERWRPIPEKFLTQRFFEKIQALESSVSGVAWRTRNKVKCPEVNRDNKAHALTTVASDSEVFGIFQKPRGYNAGTVFAEKSGTVNASSFAENNIVIGRFRGKGNVRIHADQRHAPTMTAHMGSGGNNVPVVGHDYLYRKLTVTECERLQTLPDGYTAGVSNTQRYKAIGNAWTVDVVGHILDLGNTMNNTVYYNQGGGDEQLTPDAGVKIILPHITHHKGKIIWCPFDQANSAFVRVLREAGHTVIYSHIADGQDFFEYEPERWDIILSNPPYKQKRKYWERCLDFGKPFALLLPVNILSDSMIVTTIPNQERELQLLIPDKRMRFFNCLTGETGTTPTFKACYFAVDLFERQIILEDL